MPELPSNPPIIREIVRNIKQESMPFPYHNNGRPHDLIAEETMINAGEEFVGIGTFHVVIPHPTDPEHKVIALAYRTQTSPEKAKSLFYSHKILNTLFPQNFPAIYASYATLNANEQSTKNHPSSTVRERITPATPAVEAPYPRSINEKSWQRAFHGKFRQNKHITAPFNDAINICKELGINFTVDANYPAAVGNFDPHEGNFVVGKDGGEYYIEPIAINMDHPLDAKKIESYMRQKQYSEADIQRVLHGIQRMTTISQQQISPSGD